MKTFRQNFSIRLMVDGQYGERLIMRITPKTVILDINDKAVYMLHKHFNFGLGHPEIDWHVSECKDKDGNLSYFLV